MRRVLVCGDRYWGFHRDALPELVPNPADRVHLFAELDRLHGEDPIAVVIEGGAPGGDTMAGEWADARGVPKEVYHAEWKKYGRAAGPVRNRRQLQEGHPDLTVGFHNDIAASRGTADMLRQSRRAGVPTVLFASGGGDETPQDF